jgi:Zn-dependent M28 family amino/carboxypeptidase
MDIAFRDIRSYNVVALLEGKDPELKDQYVIYTAHWDHLGKGIPAGGDSIYNGALDNASGVAATLELARLFYQHRDRLKRSVIFLNTTAEESGLLGSFHYAEYPLYPLESTIAEINIDGLNIWGRTKDMIVVGYGFSELDDYLRSAIEPQGRSVEPDAEPEKGYYYRSDHFPFAQKGVPSLYSDSGVDYVSRPPRWGLDIRKQYTTERYHKPNDEYAESWDLTGAIEDIEALFRVGLMVAGSDASPAWSEKSEFKRIREQSLEGSQ